MRYDVVIVGAGTAGIPCALEAAVGGLRVLLVDKADQVGGTLHLSGGHLAGAGTRRQQQRGIEDHPDWHYDDIMRIGRGRANRAVLRRAVDLAAGTIDWLDKLGLAQAETSPRVVYGHEPYRVARTHYGTDEARSILQLLEPRLAAAVRRGAVDLWLSSPVLGLRREPGAGVYGVTVDRVGVGTVHVEAGAVVLATGGYGANPELFDELEGHPLYSVANPQATGDGILLARAVGGAVAGRGLFLPTFGGIPDPHDPGRTLWSERTHLVATERPPWEIYVANDGRRFVAEDEPSIDAKERALLAHGSDMTFHVVIDTRGLRDGLPLLLGGSPEGIEGAANHRDGFVAADTVAELAERAGIVPANLERTIGDYNDAVTAGRPDPFGRQHRPAPLVEPPFYAIRNHGTTVITFAGVDIDDSFAVLDDSGMRIPGLYAVGEVIGAGATMGNAFCGGMTLTPALAFGRDLGVRLAAGESRPR